MSSLIDRLYSDNTGEKIKAQLVLNDPNKRYRTLYFENMVDFRLCPKNANTTIKHVYCQLNFGEDRDIGTNDREAEYLRNIRRISYDTPYLFRLASYKICVKRDPVERALSAAKYLLRTRLDIQDPSLNQIEEVLDNISVDLDFHFLSQTFWMGTPELYDKIYDISEINSLVDWLSNDYQYKYKVTDLKKNISESGIRSSDIDKNILQKVRDFYEIDYDNGWY